MKAIRRLNELAFGRPGEADVVDALRAAGAHTLSLVAMDADELVGHILFSPVEVQSPGADFRAVGLAPMAVLPDRQRRGIGSLLVSAGLAELQRSGHEAVFVLGHPDYYPRFGFARASAVGIRWEQEAPDDAFLVLELRAGALAGHKGIVRYRAEFASV